MLRMRGHGESTGLGLFVSRQIVEHHGGRIWVADAHEGGADFRFTSWPWQRGRGQVGFTA